MDDGASVTMDTDVAADVVTTSSGASDLPAGYSWNDDGSITAPLAFPPSDGPQQVVLKRLNGKAMVDVMNAKGDGDRVKRMVLGSLGMVGPKGELFFNSLDAWDVVLLGEAASSFLPSGQKTGR